MRALRFSLLSLITIGHFHLAAAELPPVPDPFGLGERLALIDYLREQGQDIPAGTELIELQQRYRQLLQQEPEPTAEAYALADQRRRLRNWLISQYQTDIGPDASLEALQTLKAKKQQAENAAVAAMLAASEAEGLAAAAQEPSASAPASEASATLHRTPQHSNAAEPAWRPRNYPTVFIDRIHEIPDLYQVSRRLGHQGGGYFHCVPTAISNSLMWLANQGYAKLAFDRPGQDRAHWELARLLASPEYMGTDARSGTLITDTMQGIKRFIGECGYDLVNLETQGLPFNREFTHWNQPSSLTFIKSGLMGDSAIWLTVGYYEREGDALFRRAGHLVTVTGYGRNKRGDRDPNVLVINDPADGERNIMAYVQTDTLPAETYLAHGRHRFSLADFLILGDGYPTGPDGLLAVVEVAIHLEIRR